MNANCRSVAGDSAAVSKLLSFPRFGEGVGLHRMRFFLDSLPLPAWESRLDAIKVTGSKGKGSVSALTAEILRHLGITTGLFTSPHLVHFHERIKIDGACINDQELAVAADWVLNLRDRYEREYPGDRIGAFEAFTAAALYHFCTNGVPALVSEAGIGGRYDATRVIPGRVVALTSVELEHTKILGTSLPLIAYDKSDLCPDGGTLVIGQLDGELLRRLREYCRIRSVELLEAGENAPVSNISYDAGVMHFNMSCAGIKFDNLGMRLLGGHQARNAAVAVLTAWQWRSLNRPEISMHAFQDAVRSALIGVEWPGRFQRISVHPEIVIDVGHTPQSLRSVADTIRQTSGHKAVLLVTGVSVDKDINGILAEIVPVAAAAVCTRAYHKGAPVSVVAASCEAIRKSVVWRSAETIEEAMKIAVARAESEDMIVLVAGGLFLAVEAMVCLQGRDPQQLHFF